VALAACDTMSNVANDALSLVGLGDSPKPEKTKSKKSKTEPEVKDTASDDKTSTDTVPSTGTDTTVKDDTTEPKDTAAHSNKPEIVRNTQTLTPKAQKKDLKRSAVAPEFKEDAR
jgi:hypothetical protein